MKKVLRKCVLGAGGLVLLGLAAVVGLGLLARKHVTRTLLVELAEKEINSRVEIGEVRVSLFKGPATITLREVSLSPRTPEVGKELSERAPVVDAPVRVSEVRLQVRLGALLRKRVEIVEFVFVNPHLAITLYEDGENSLDELLRSPEPEKAGPTEAIPPQVVKAGRWGHPRVIASETPATGSGPAADRGGEAPTPARTLNIHAHGFLAHVREVRLERGTLELTIEKTGMVVKGREFTTRLDEIEVDPAALEKTNAARLSTQGRIEIDAIDDSELRYAEIGVDGQAEVVLFDPVTGDLRPDVLAKLSIREGTYLSTDIPVIQKGWRALGKLESFGLKLGDLPARAEFGRSRSLEVHYHDERFTLQAPISIWFADWEVAILAGAWIQTESESHEARAEVLATEELTAKFRSELQRGLERVPEDLREPVAEEVGKTWFRSGRLGAVVTSSGLLSKPKVSLLENLPEIGEILKRAGKDLIKNRLPGLLDKLFEKAGEK